MLRRTGGADALRLSTLVRTPGDPSSERGSDSAAALSKGDANQIRHHQPQELTVRENGAGPSRPHRHQVLRCLLHLLPSRGFADSLTGRSPP